MDNTDRPVIFDEWNGTRISVTYNEAEDASKVWYYPYNDLDMKTQLSTEYFYESDVPYNSDDKYRINALATYKDRLYAGCDGGLVIVFTDCVKCYKLKKPVDFDIKFMSIEDGVMYVEDNDENYAEINMSDIGGDSIEVDEANLLVQNGGIYVDVRSSEEFAENHYEPSVNIPVDTLEEGLAQYDKDTVLIFYCASGVRSAAAVEKAKAMGFTNVYNLGSINKLI